MPGGGGGCWGVDLTGTLPGRKLLSVHLGNLNSGTQTCIVCARLLYGFVHCFNFNTTSVVEKKHTIPKCCDSEAILSKMLFPGHPGWSVHMEKFSSPLPRSRSRSPRSRKPTQPGCPGRLIWRGPRLRTPVRVRVAKAVKMQSRLAWNSLFANFSALY